MRLTGLRGQFLPTPMLVFGMAIAVTFLSWLVIPPDFSQTPDYNSGYAPVARNFLAGNGWVDNQGVFSSRYPPGYSLILTGVFAVANAINLSEQAGVGILILLCAGASAALLYLMARSFWDRGRAFAVALVWMTYPFNIYFSQYPGSEVPFMVAFFGVTALFSRLLTRQLHRPADRLFLFLVCGGLIGLASLIRPAAVGLGLVAALIVLVSVRPLRLAILAAVAILAGNGIVIAPWQAVLYHNTRSSSLLSEGGFFSVRDGLTYALTSTARTPIPTPTNVLHLQERLRVRYQEMRTFDGITQVLLDELRNDPLTVIQLLATKAVRSWFATDSGEFDSVIGLIQIPYLLLSVWSTRLARKRGMIGLALGVWVVVLYFWATTFAALSILRYMVPVMGMLFLLFPLLISDARSRWRSV